MVVDGTTALLTQDPMQHNPANLPDGTYICTHTNLRRPVPPCVSAWRPSC